MPPTFPTMPTTSFSLDDSDSPGLPRTATPETATAKENERIRAVYASMEQMHTWIETEKTP